MKKILRSLTASLVLAFAILLLQGCLKDSYTRTYSYSYYVPVYKTTAEVRANIKSNGPKPVEKPGKIYIRGQYIFLNEIDKGIHIIDNANPSSPRNIAFIDIPGNMDLAVKGDVLYADLYTDLVAIDISNPLQVAVKKLVEGIFPHRYYSTGFAPDTSRIIASWEKRDTTVSESFDQVRWAQEKNIFINFSAASSAGGNGQSFASVSPYGVGGSMARFAIMGNRLYTVGDNYLDAFNISDPVNPFNTARKNVGRNIETIYPFQNHLFIGSTSGMYIYNVSNPDNLVETGKFGHVESCDPVIADQQHAYVTLRSGTVCQGFSNQLEILNLNDLANPTLVKVYQLTNPRGLSKDGNTLFICDGRDGLKVFDASNVSNLRLLKTIGGMETYDVITLNGNAIVVANDGLYQYDYSNLSDIRLRSRITLSN
ncbi:MAG TPA: hypothetical protein VFR58_01965 [Flavisolibacter sp.]|nr:hypothetical protein [Flavisolibacter sp.]